MCVAALAWQAHPRWQVVLASNRDEFTERPTEPLHAWATPGGTPIWAGRDARAGGTWLAVSATRLALVTNRRSPAPPLAGAPSRGSLPLAAIDGAPLPAAALWNLLVADWGRDAGAAAWRASSEALEPQVLTPGIATVSNGALNACWPKQRRLAGFVQVALAAPDAAEADALTARLMAALADRMQPPEASWPATGIPHEAEGWLAPIHVVAPDGRYRTRVSTVVLVAADEDAPRIVMTERRWDSAGWVSSATVFDQGLESSGA